MIRRNSFFGLLGFAVPALVLVASYPVLVRHLGMARLGVYFLATSMSGALAFLDAGFSAATLKFLAEDLAHGRKEDAGAVLGASMWFYGAVGIAGGVGMAMAAPWLVRLFRVEAGLQREAVSCFRLASIQFAVFFLLTVLVSLFKGMQRFHLSTLSLSVLSVLTYGGAVAFAGWGLIGITAVGVVANVVVLAGAAGIGWKLCGAAGIRPFAVRPTMAVYRRMLGFGSAMLINGVASLFQNQIQRYVIGMTLGPAAVGIYQTASVAPGKIHAAVHAATEVMFPFSAAGGDRVRVRRTYLKMLGGTAAFAGTALLLLVWGGPWFLSRWLGRDFSAELGRVLRIFAVAYFFLALTPPPYHLLNGLGRPWVNTLFFGISAVVNVGLIGVSWVLGISLTGIAWAYAIAAMGCVPVYYVVVERVVWIRMRTSMPTRRLAVLSGSK